MNTLAATVEAGSWSMELSFFSLVFTFLAIIVFIIAAYDGMKFVFRGTRDYMSIGHEKPTALARLGGAVAAFGVLLSGLVLFIAVIGWLAGAGMFTQKPGRSSKRDADQAENFETPLRAPSD